MTDKPQSAADQEWLEISTSVQTGFWNLKRHMMNAKHPVNQERAKIIHSAILSAYEEALEVQP